MLTSAIIDFGALFIVLLFTALGARKGLFRTLAGMMVFVLAMMGASAVTEQYGEKAAERVIPVIEERLTGQFASAMEETARQSLGNLASESDVEDLPAGALESMPRQELLSLPEDLHLPEGVERLLTEELREKMSSLRGTAAGTVGDVLRETIHQALQGFLPPLISRALFVVSFLVLSVVLKLAVKMFDPVFDLPLLRTLNSGGGALIGLVQGLLIALILLWIVAQLGPIVGQDAVDGSFALGLLSRYPIVEHVL